ncbi:hypothetical protein AVL59_00670 [Streptomyces griseochromogenes]|uniref:Uncharacterized protein n=1 Tax=Streptomyces griseochromogenes TaxID=68214 RepID=A0A1B1ANX3_9ACTN|nr:hypothetical protein AVL59_00670 [Streptomyces griseochromogenes]
MEAESRDVPQAAGGAGAPPGTPAPGDASRTGGAGGKGLARGEAEASAVAACVTAILTALFGSWGTWSAPLGEALPGFPLPWGVTAGPPLLLVSLAGVLVGWAGAPSFARTWAHTAGALTAATALLALPHASLDADGLWATLSEAAHAGLFGVLAGWAPALAALTVTRRRAPRPTGLAPYVWTTAVAALGPLLYFGVSTALSSSARPSPCTATGCITPHAQLLFTGEVALRLMLPAWAAAIAVLAVARRTGRIRNLRGVWQVLLALCVAGLTVLCAPGLVFGADV